MKTTTATTTNQKKNKINNCRIHIGTRSACNIIHSALYPSWLHVESRTPTASTHSNHVHMTIFEQSPSSVLFVSSYIFYIYIFFSLFSFAVSSCVAHFILSFPLSTAFNIYKNVNCECVKASVIRIYPPYVCLHVCSCGEHILHTVSIYSDALNY